MDRWVCVAQFGAPHGVKGAIRLTAFTAEPDTLKQLAPLHRGAGGPPLRVRFLRPDKAGFLVQVDGYADRESVAALTGQRVHVPRTALPEDPEEDSFYIADLEGLAVRGPDGGTLGRVQAVQDFGAGDLLDILLDEPVADLGRSVLIPFERRYVPRVQVREGYLVADLAHWLDNQILGREQ
ncbi:MAG: ribosome maturation factor RimM [Rhodothalassiaceae bacterium]